MKYSSPTYLIFLFSYLLFIGCSNSVIPILQEPTDSFKYELIWEQPINPDSSGVYSSLFTSFKNGKVLVERKVIGQIPERSDLLALNSESGKYEWNWNGDKKLLSLANPIILEENNIYQAVLDTYYSMNIDTGVPNWFFDYDENDFGIYDFNFFTEDEIISIARNDVSTVTKNKIISINKATGERETLLDINHDNDGYFKAIRKVAPYTSSSGESMLIICLAKYKFSPWESIPIIMNYNLTQDSILWEIQNFEQNGSFSGYNHPIIEDDLVYFRGSRSFFCVDINTGDLKWEKRYPSVSFGGNYMIIDDNVVLSTDDGEIILLNKTNGEEKYFIDFGPAVFSMNYFEGKLFFTNGKLMIVDLLSGEVLHEFETKNSDYNGSFFSNNVAINPLERIMYVLDFYFVQAIKIPE